MKHWMFVRSIEKNYQRILSAKYPAEPFLCRFFSWRILYRFLLSSSPCCRKSEYRTSPIETKYRPSLNTSNFLCFLFEGSITTPNRFARLRAFCKFVCGIWLRQIKNVAVLQENMIDALMREYPHLDRMMCETLVKAYENGTLDKYNFDSQPPPIPQHPLLKGYITVSNQTKNIEVSE